MKKIYNVLIISILFSCQNKEEYFQVNHLNQLNGFWKSGTNIIEINAKDSILTFNSLKDHSLKVEIIDSNFILLGENTYGDESFNGLIKINAKGDKVFVKRTDNHYKILLGSKTIYQRHRPNKN
tara:strand:+ start:384 stop:755 length:372 start_codon:yes stop_codon:yes gene_type:complete